MTAIRAALVAFALVAVAVPADAQFAQNPTAIQLKIAAIEEPLGANVTAIAVHGTYSGTAGATLSQTTVAFRIETPPWLVGTMSPSTVQVAPFGSPSIQFNVPFTTTLLVSLWPDAPGGLIGEVRVVAEAYENMHLKGSSAAASTLVISSGVEQDRCDEGVIVASADGTEAAAEPTTVEAQSASVVAASGPVVGGLALLGAAGGGAYVLRRRG